MESKHAFGRGVLGGLILALAIAVPAIGQQVENNTGGAASGSSTTRTLAPGTTYKIDGIIVSTDAGAFKVKEYGGSEFDLVISGRTQIREKKGNPFRGAVKYRVDQLVKGLAVETKGRGNSSGGFDAEEIRFTQDDLRFAQSLQTRVAPVEARLTETEGQLKKSEQEAQHMAGQIDELAAVSNAARGGAKAAQETADSAQRSADQANSGVRATNERISSLDDFDVQDTGTLHFKAASATLTPEAQAELDRLANRAKTMAGYLIEVTGHASSDGNEAYNVRLSERRAQAAVRYLVEQDGVPLRRIVTPFGFGEKHPAADNTTKDGRVQNRRVDVRLLVSKGLEQKAAASASLNSNVN